MYSDVYVASTSGGFGDVKILIAEDNQHLRRVLRVLLESREGWSICAEAENGVEAVSMATQHRPDLVLLDLVMPQMDGLAAARKISETLPGTPILMHTLFASPHLELEAKKHGVQRVIPKAAGHMLVPAIEEALAQIPQRDDALPPPAITSPLGSAAKPLPTTPHEPATQSKQSAGESTASAFPAQLPPGRLLPLHADWQTAFQAALREEDPAKIQHAIEQARLMMNDSAIELTKEGSAADSPDRKALEDALRKLAIHEQRTMASRAPDKSRVN
jgi:CheY-like chemotaxis protein